MNHRQLGCYRDRAIVAAVEQYRCLDAEQVQVMLFPMRSGQRKCQMRLKRLTDRGRLKRWRYSLDRPYAYYIERCEQVEHVVLRNWALLWLERGLHGWEEMRCTYEVKYPALRTDAFVAIKNKVTGAHRFTFLELDRAESGNEFDKVKRYNDLYESGDYAGQWWVPLTKRFPAVMICTTSGARVRRIQKAIERENRNGLEFTVHIVDELRREVLSRETQRTG